MADKKVGGEGEEKPGTMRGSAFGAGWHVGHKYHVCCAPGWFFTGELEMIMPDADSNSRTLVFGKAAWIQELGRMADFFRRKENDAQPQGFHAEMITPDDDAPRLNVHTFAVLWWRELPDIPEKTTERANR